MKPAPTIYVTVLIALMLFRAQAQTTPTISLDVGNDTDPEWIASSTFAGPETLDVTGSVNGYVRGGCWCAGCVHDTGTDNCTVPIVLESQRPGNLTVNDVKLTFSRARKLREVTYGMPFRLSDGGCWEIQHQSGVLSGVAVPPGFNNGDCSGGSYNYKEGATAPPSEYTGWNYDAIDDAMYRLLNQTLDADQNGVIDIAYNKNMSFQAEGRIGVQTLWGPLQMRLIVWV